MWKKRTYSCSKFCCSIFIGVRIIKEMPGSVVSGTPFILTTTTYWTHYILPLCNKSQLDAQFILRLFHQSTCTCFGHICSPSSRDIWYIYNNWYVLCHSVDCLLAGLRWNSILTQPTNCQLKSTTRTNCCTHTVYCLMMGYKYARNMYRLIDEINQG
jgi:hypothetical protein